MTPEEAIKEFKVRIALIEKDGYVDLAPEFTEAMKMAISALEKQSVDKCCETCKYEHLELDEYPCSDCIRAKDHYVPYTEEE